MKLHFSGHTHTGRVRRGNQDILLVAELGSTSNPPALPAEPSGDPAPPPIHGTVPFGSRGALLLLADGLGGPAGGEVASRLAVETIAAEMREAADADAADVDDPDAFAERLREAIRRSHLAILEKASLDPSLAGMGTTLTAAGTVGDRVVFAQVGDSRGYLFRNRSLRQRTRDQSQVQAMVDAGEITPAEARLHPRRNVVLQALGAIPDAPEVAFTTSDLLPGDRILLCSDGLTDVVTDDEIAAVLGARSDLTEAGRELVDRANEAGGPDNVSLLLAEVAARGDGP